jgi:hypothetical protein
VEVEPIAIFDNCQEFAYADICQESGIRSPNINDSRPYNPQKCVGLGGAESFTVTGVKRLLTLLNSVWLLPLRGPGTKQDVYLAEDQESTLRRPFSSILCPPLSAIYPSKSAT